MLSTHTTPPRRRALLWLVIGTSTALAACSSDSPTTVPSALNTSFTSTLLGDTPISADIAGAGDSVVVTVVEPNTCGYDEGATASQQNGTMDVIVSLTSEDPSLCDPAPGSTQYRVAVLHVSPGTYTVVAHYRTAISTQINDAVVGSRTITLP